MASSNPGRGLAYFAEPYRSPPSESRPTSVIPIGTVRRIRTQVEARVAAHHRESASLLIARARNYVLENLYGTSLAYRDKLRIVEQLGLTHLTTPIAGFLRVHEDMFQAVVRTQHMAMRAATSPTIDVLIQAEICILNLRNQISYNDVLSTLNGTLLQNMRVSGDFEEETFKIASLLAAEFAATLLAWEDRSSNELEDLELENVGPDHDIDTLGKDIQLVQAMMEPATNVSGELRPTHNRISFQVKESTAVEATKNPSLLIPPPSPMTTPENMSIEALMNETDDEYDEEDDEDQLCGICMEAYTDSHHPFCLAACGHIYGKPCISQWVNSIAPNANLCPKCRTSLCTRRRRRPSQAYHGQVMPSRADQRVLQSRLDRTTRLFDQLADAHGALFGPESRDPFYHVCMTSLNYRFFNMDLRWYVRPTEGSPTGWILQRVNWHQ